MRIKLKKKISISNFAYTRRTIILFDKKHPVTIVIKVMVVWPKRVNNNTKMIKFVTKLKRISCGHKDIGDCNAVYFTPC